jgi:hypothetical protein
MRAEEIVMRIHSQWKKFFITVPFLLAIFLLAVPTSRVGATGPSTPLFLPPVTYNAGAFATEFVAVADVNGDGKPDLVIAIQNAPNGSTQSDGLVGVLLGNGNGTFQAPVTYDSGGNSPFSLAVADLNGDGRPDIVIPNFCVWIGNTCSFTTVGILLGNGDGSFQAVVKYDPGTTGSTSVAIADVNRDGKPDLIIAGLGAGKVSVLLGNGNGTFQPAVLYDAGVAPYSVAVADLNGDGKPDVVISGSVIHNNSGNTLGVLLGNGDGTFQPAVTYDSGASAGGWANSVVIADLNGDGRLDLAVAHYPDSTTGVLLGNGDGTVQPVVLYGSGAPLAWTVASADVNGNGKADLIVADFSGIVGVLSGNGDGTFQKALTYKVPGDATSITAADVNGDGRPDLIVTNGNSFVSVLLNTRASEPTTTALVSSLNPSIYGQNVIWSANVTTSESLPPTGKVSFAWDGHSIGTATLNSGGVATLTRSNLNADSYPLTAAYLGDADHARSTSAILNQVVKQTTSATTLSSSPNPLTQGQAVTFTAKISSPTVTATGPVTFTVGKTVLGTAQLSKGKASFTTSTLAVGSTIVTATYYGDSNIAKSSASVKQSVQQ